MRPNSSVAESRGLDLPPDFNHGTLHFDMIVWIRHCSGRLEMGLGGPKKTGRVVDRAISERDDRSIED